MRILTALSLAVLVLAASRSAQSEVSGLPLMKVDLSARPAGMGGAFTAVSGDPAAAMYNPAAVSGLTGVVASFGHLRYWENISLSSLFVGADVHCRTTLYGAIRYSALNELEARDGTASLEPDALFSANTGSLKGGVSYRLHGSVWLGVALGWYFDKIESWRGTAFNADAGLLVRPIATLLIGVSAMNLGADYALSKSASETSRDIKLPRTVRLGGAYTYQWLTGHVDLVHLDEAVRAQLGAEAKVHPMLTVRSGYAFNYDTRSFTAGVTIHWRNLGLNYAAVPYTDNLGLTHAFSLNATL